MREVVGVAILEDGRVLAARRARPAGARRSLGAPRRQGRAGGGPSSRLRCARSRRSSAATSRSPVRWRASRQLRPARADDLVLRVVTARLADGDPVPHEHDAVRWLRAGRARRGDAGRRPTCRSWTRCGTCWDGRLMRGVFFDEDHARTVVARLVARRFRRHCEREPFAGEDDDEDHPWVVSTRRARGDARAARGGVRRMARTRRATRRRPTPIDAPDRPATGQAGTVGARL